jgi:hypothetical protein
MLRGQRACTHTGPHLRGSLGRRRLRRHRRGSGHTQKKPPQELHALRPALLVQRRHEADHNDLARECVVVVGTQPAQLVLNLHRSRTVEVVLSLSGLSVKPATTP